MVVGAFPLAKLGLLAIRQVSKPIANTIKDKAKESPVFRQYICMPPAQFYNWCEVKFKMWTMKLGTPINVPRLNEAMAIELGANLLGESIIFVIASAVVIFEYVRQSKKQSYQEEEAKLEKLALYTTISEIGFRLERQDTQIRELTRVIADLDSRSIFKKKVKKIADYKMFDSSTPDQSLSQPNGSSNNKSSDSHIQSAINSLQTKISVGNTKDGSGDQRK